MSNRKLRGLLVVLLSAPRRIRRELSRTAPLSSALFLAGATACGGSPAHHDTLIDNPLLSLGETPDNPLLVRDGDARPRLTLLPRAGDPRPALVLVADIDDPVASAALASLVSARLGRAGFAVEPRALESAFVIAWRPETPAQDPEPYLEALTRALTDPVGSEEKLGVDRAFRALTDHRATTLGEHAVRRCEGEPTLAPAEGLWDPAAPDATKRMEQARATRLTVPRLALGAVGEQRFCDAVASSWEQVDGWPSSAPPPRRPVPANTADARIGGVGSASLHLALRADHPVAAIAAADALGAPNGALSARLAAPDLGFRLRKVAGIAKPDGGCLSFALDHRSPTPSPGEVQGALLAVRREAERALAEPPSAIDALRPILEAQDASTAAERAAWWALSGKAPDAAGEAWAALALPDAELLEAGEDLAPYQASLKAGLADAPAAAQIETRVREEPGQGALVALLAPRCRPASSAAAAELAVGLAAAAWAATPPPDVGIEPWLTADVIGLMARATPRPGEDPNDTAQRLGQALGTMLGREPRTTAIEEARATLMMRLDEKAGPQGAVLEQFAELAAPSRAHELVPFSPLALGASDVERIQSAWRSVQVEPLRVAILTNRSGDQATALTRELSRYVGSSQASCPSHAAGAAPTGRGDLVIPNARDVAQSVLGVPAAPIGKAEGTAALMVYLALDRHGGLERAMAELPSVTARAHLLGGATESALAIDLRGPPEAVDQAEKALPAMLEELERRTQDRKMFDALLASAAAYHTSLFGSARARANHVWATGQATAALPQPTPAQLAAVFSELRKGALRVRLRPDG